MIWQRCWTGRGAGPADGLGRDRRPATRRQAVPLVQAGAAWGRGLDSVPLLKRIPGGWLAVDARVKLAAKPSDDTAIDPQACPTR